MNRRLVTQRHRAALAGPLLVGLLATMGACASDPPAVTLAAPPAVAVSPTPEAPRPAEAIDVAITDDAVTVSGPVRPGGTLRIRNDGAQLHMMLLGRFRDGRGPADLVAAQQSPDPSAMDAVLSPVGAPSVHLAPGTALEVTTAGLVAGRYALADFYPAEGGDGSPIAMSARPVEVVVQGEAVSTPVADTMLKVTQGQAIAGPGTLAAGRHVLAISGLSKAAGLEFGIYRLRDGDTFESVSKSFHQIFDVNDGAGLLVRGAGARVAMNAIGWVLPPDDGGTVLVGVTLEPGTYVLAALDIDGGKRPAPVVERVTVRVT